LLDAAIAERHLSAIADYYRALAGIDAVKMQATVNQLAKNPTEKLAPLFPKYLAERFLYDYLEDQPLLNRLNGIVRRVNLPELPSSMCSLIQAVRPQVRERQGELLRNTQSSPHSAFA
jgi:hypothetical protein